MYIKGVYIHDTFAEAFALYGTRFIITAANRKWALQAAQSVTGFATSIIGCGCEAGIEGEVSATPDDRPGVAVLLFATSFQELEKQLLARLGQCVMTCPTTACYNGLASDGQLQVGGKLRYFGDGWQASKVIAGQRYWRIPVMEGEFLIQESFGYCKGVGGGNFLLLGTDDQLTLAAATKAVEAMEKVAGVIMPFPGGIVRSGSKVGSRYKSLLASTNTAYCPSLRGRVESALPSKVNSVLEIVIDGLDLAAVEEATRVGIRAACEPGIVQITAGNYGGKLGQYKIQLRSVLE
ncbi:MAG TPA: formylmethanofuran--tetrahydromethanopterin N-formyltransferase [Firmicutes bacterium]|nr:formylmethanofuran--tetrahydromethanopterin N-formyltransferase [Bacillota bacterium]